MSKKIKPVEIVVDPVESAKAAGLRYVSDTRPGIQRRRRGESFGYVDADGSPVRDKETLARIKALVIPPAWSEVWICPNPKGHLQATGRDVKGRKQSRYHPHWREVRDETKYERMLIFGEALPRIRQKVEHDLSLPGLPRAKVLATIVRLMETTLIRIGNEEYARSNKSYGLTTMRNRHVQVDGATVTFTFLGKSRVQHAIDVSDRRLAKIVQRCMDLPGYELFQYIDPEGDHRTIDSADVNEYLQEIADGHFTAKDFRTWAGTVLACMTLQEFEAFESESQAKKNVVQAIKQVAERLGNTVSVCRKCYIHPAVLQHYMGGSMVGILKTCVQLPEDAQCKHDLRREETMVMHLLQQKRTTVRA
ncbi:DNA topoisomerase IB [Granulicella arctica]|uniref:DNA topoisomerase IB n=1 Tax=Granulicella arctica TaxID=940613 RepID=UPI0021DF914E|nr:DNA topoisomerase IB [Granulicella arctica]